jgi:hypothetical protein
MYGVSMPVSLVNMTAPEEERKTNTNQANKLQPKKETRI